MKANIDMSLAGQLIACLSLYIVLGGCTAHGSVSATYPAAAEHYDIPAGHMPPPNECRIWFPGREAGQQPPPGDCYELEMRVPPGAVLVRG